MNTKLVIDAGMVVSIWQKKLRMASVLNDPVMRIKGNYDPNTKTIPNGCVINVPAKTGVLTERISILLPLEGSGITSETAMNGNEDTRDFRYLDVYADLVGNALRADVYGMSAHLDRFYNILRENTPLLSQWHKEVEGRYFREAICQRYSANLIPSQGVTQSICSNILVANLGRAAYSKTPATYITNINNLWINGSIDKNLDINLLNKLSKEVTFDLILEPVQVGGKEGYIFMVPTNQMSNLWDLTTGGTTVSDFAKYDGLEKILGPNYFGSWKNLHLVEDARYPTADIQAATLTFKYKGPGRLTDGRDAPGATIAHVGMIVGKGALFKYKVEDLFWREGIDVNYGRRPGYGAFQTYGYTSSEYDLDGSVLDTDRLNDGVALVMLGSS